MSTASTADVLNGLLEPWIFLWFSLTYLPGTILQELARGGLVALASWDSFSFAWFGNFWKWAGPMVRNTGEARVAPLLQGRVRSGTIIPTSDAVQPGVGGTVIEIGPGSGMWVSIFADKYAGASVETNGERTPVKKVYGVEPNPAHHAALAQRAKDAGLEDRYQIVPVGIEDITPALIEKGSVDAIVTVLCLCSIPDPEKNIRELYTYLKPGGRWFVYEHVVTHKPQGIWMRIYQSK
jgi:SAM-dependent methyltransferase